MVAPYYDRAGITIYLADCRDLLPSLRADVAITDPPYGVGLVTKTSRYRGQRTAPRSVVRRASVLYDDDPERVRALIVEVMPLILAATDRALVFSGSRMLYAYPEPAALGCVYIPNGVGRSRWGFACFQPILYYGADPFYQDGLGGRPNGFQTEQPNRETIDHPCPKPLAWMRWAVGRASREGETVLDPFCGSGTTLVAAKALGRKAIGIEVEERYAEIAARRLAQDVLPLEAAG